MSATHVWIIAAVAFAASTTSAADVRSRSPVVTTLATLGSGSASGSTIGPDGALYVTDPNAGSVERVDRRTGAVTTLADGLPRAVIGVGGAMDVVFKGRTAYVLVTLVGGDIIGGPHIGDETVGIYRLGRDGVFTAIADIGVWSIDHPPTSDHFITTGVQFALQRYAHGFLVTDGHHNRVLRVDLDGTVQPVKAFGNIVPTGLETVGSAVLMTAAGPIPHLPADGKVMAFWPRSKATIELARGASMLVDVEHGRGSDIYVLSQGQWDGVAEGSPALPDTGRLLKVDWRGGLEPVLDRYGNELVFDRPVSLEITGNTAYVVGLSGTIVKIENL